jgi:hypothetical protein
MREYAPATRAVALLHIVPSFYAARRGHVVSVGEEWDHLFVP